MTENKKNLNRQLQNAYSHGSHFLIRLTYASQAQEGLPASELKSILESAREKNKARGITGALIFNKHYFLQCIEGSRPIINELVNELVADPRHHNFQIISTQQVESRIWADWDMNYFSPSHANIRDFMRYSALPTFNPYIMTSQSIDDIFKTMASKTPITEEKQTEPAKKGLFSFFSKNN